jgi:8-oxo-dGTP pyrophosphatase MutT (NUDIX family)
LEACALREVQEETGLKDVSMEKPLLVTWHTYDDSGKHILKETHWYTMKTSSSQSLLPQQEEQITELKWVAKKDLRTMLSNTFPSIVDVIKAGAV